MFRVPGAGDAVALGLEIVSDVGMRHAAPAVRVGMHTGPAIERGGDRFGTTVNLAARVAGAAGGGEVLLTEATKHAAGPLVGVEITARGSQRFKNITQATVINAASREDPSAKQQWPIDPVCRMAVDPARRAGVLTHSGREYSFCSLHCASAFAKTPDRYTETVAG